MMQMELTYSKCASQGKEEDLVCLDTECDQDQVVICSWCHLKKHSKHSHNIHIIKELVTSSQKNLESYYQIYKDKISITKGQFDTFDQIIETTKKQIITILDGVREVLKNNFKKAEVAKIRYQKDQDFLETIINQLGQKDFLGTKEQFLSLYRLTLIGGDQFKKEIDLTQNAELLKSNWVIEDVSRRLQPFVEVEISQLRSLSSQPFEQLRNQWNDLQQKHNQLLIQHQEEKKNQEGLCRIILDKQRLTGEEIENLKLHSSRRQFSLLSLIKQNVYPGEGIAYTLSLSSSYPNQIQNTVEALINNDFNKSGVATKDEQNSFIMATFDEEKYISLVYIAELVHKKIGFNKNYINGKEFQYSRDGASWTTLFKIQGIGDQPNECYRVFGVYQAARYFRIFNPQGDHIALGTLIFT